MKIKFYFFAVLLTVFGLFNAQEVTIHKLISAGYVYQNQSFGTLGGKLLLLNNDDVIFRAGAAAMVGATNKKFVIMPKLDADFLFNFERSVDFYHSYYLLLGAETTTKYIAPKVGFTLFGLVDLTGGYAFSLDKNGVNGRRLKGLNVNFTLNIPIVLLD